MKVQIRFLLFILAFGISTPSFSQDYLKEIESGFKGKINKDIKVREDAFSFLVMGDFGRMGEYHQKTVADELARTAIAIDPEFIISVGDNFYPTGVESVDDPQWKYSFEDIYTPLSLHTDWYVALGNHDYAGNIQAQIDYSKISRRWQMPAPYYKETFEMDNGDKLLMVVIDTNPYIKKYYERGGYFKNNLAKQDTLAQNKWIEEALGDKDPKIKWKIVVGHHPLYSGGKRKTSAETEDIRIKFAKLFDKYKVDAYLTGHEHDLQIIRPKGAYTTQFLSGSASETRPSGMTDGSIFAAAEPGFMAFSILGNSMWIQVVKEDGSILYETELKK